MITVSLVCCAVYDGRWVEIGFIILMFTCRVVYMKSNHDVHRNINNIPKIARNNAQSSAIGSISKMIISQVFVLSGRVVMAQLCWVGACFSMQMGEMHVKQQ
jgi:uncharacterized membrane protein YqhA